MKRLAVLLIAVFAMPLLADDSCDVSTVEKALDCKVSALEGNFSTAARPRVGPENSSQLESATTAKVANSTRATTPPDAFAARIHNSYQDFLVPLSFAINKVEESKDGQALTVRFNPIRDPGWEVGLTATASKPTVADSVKNAIAESSRDTTVSAIQKKLGDFDDVIVALSITNVTKHCEHLTDRCFGRNPKTYWDVASTPVLALARLASSGPAQQATTDLFNAAGVAFAAESGSPLTDRLRRQAFQKTLGEVTSDPIVRQRIYDLAKRAGELDAGDTKAYLAAFKAGGLENLSTLIDNQPELALTGTYHDLGPFSGPDQVSASVDFQVGRYHLTNIGQVVSAKNLGDAEQAHKDQCKSDIGDAQERERRQHDCYVLLAALPMDGLSSYLSDKFVFNVTYTKTDRYKVDSLGDIDSTPFTPIDLKRASEWKGKAQWGRKLGMLVKDERPRLDVSAEFHRTSADGVRTLNRFVATTTLTVPWGATASIPVSLAYANKSQFLNDSRKQLSMHFGLSYRFPWEQQQ